MVVDQRLKNDIFTSNVRTWIDGRQLSLSMLNR